MNQPPLFDLDPNRPASPETATTPATPPESAVMLPQPQADAADFFSCQLERTPPYYAIRYPDRLRMKKTGQPAFFFMVYRRADSAPVFESSTYDEQELCDIVADQVTAEFINEERQLLLTHEMTEEEYNTLIKNW